MPLDRIERSRQLYDGGICGGCGVRLDATICRCDPQFWDAGKDTVASASIGFWDFPNFTPDLRSVNPDTGQYTRWTRRTRASVDWNVIEGEQH